MCESHARHMTAVYVTEAAHIMCESHARHMTAVYVTEAAHIMCESHARHMTAVYVTEAVHRDANVIVIATTQLHFPYNTHTHTLPTLHRHVCCIMEL